jgi:hypothetical protein
MAHQIVIKLKESDIVKTIDMDVIRESYKTTTNIENSRAFGCIPKRSDTWSNEDKRSIGLSAHASIFCTASL